jgi:hypothetical protein
MIRMPLLISTMMMIMMLMMTDASLSLSPADMPPLPPSKRAHPPLHHQK